MMPTPMKLWTLSDLQNSGFGQPRPRHGLQLLYWFAKDCIWIIEDDDMQLLCDPETGHFGFHEFENRYTGQNTKLLPEVGFRYFLLGNLNSPGAKMLPTYVRKDNTGIRDCNTDRIIVAVHGERKFGKVYLTTHKDPSGYDPNRTFHISRSLLKIIQNLSSLNDFLQQVQKAPMNMCLVRVQIPVHSDSDSETEACDFDTEVTTRADKTPCRNCGCIIL